MAWAPIIAAVLPTLLAATGVGAKKGEHGSTYSSGALNTIDDILADLKNMKGGAQDITQNQNYQGGQEWLNSLFSDPDFFKNFEAPIKRQYEEETIPGLANRFASMGSGGSLGSTAFRNQLAREGSNLQTNLAALRGGMQQQGVNQSLQYAQQPFNNWLQMLQSVLQPTQNTYQPPSNPWANIAAPIVGGVAQGYAQQGGQNQANQNFAGQHPSTGYNYPLTGMYDQGFRSGQFT